MKSTITGPHDEIIDEAQAIVAGQGGHVPATIAYNDRTTRKVRLATGADGTLMRMAKGRRRYGYALRHDRKPIAAITLDLPDSPAQCYADSLRRRRDYFRRNADPRLWADLRATLETVTDEDLAQLASADCASYFEAWELAGEMGLPRVEPFKTTTLKSCQAPHYVIEGVREAIGVSQFEFAWRGRYDYRASGKLCDDGVWRAWLSQEYKDLGNGHYYLLISAEKAIFCEDD